MNDGVTSSLFPFPLSASLTSLLKLLSYILRMYHCLSSISSPMRFCSLLHDLHQLKVARTPVVAAFFFTSMCVVRSAQNRLPCFFKLTFTVDMNKSLSLPLSLIFTVRSMRCSRAVDPNWTSPASAAKFTQAVVLLPAKAGTYGGQMCSEIYSFVTTAAGSQIWNYLSARGWNRSTEIVC